MIIEIDDDCVDSIIQTALVRDYAYLTSDLEAHKKKSKFMHEEDVEAYEETVKGIEILSKWYFAVGEFKKAVKKFKKEIK